MQAAPKHVAIIMDGNGRWAQLRKLSRIHGHKAGVESVRKVVKQSIKLKIETLTLFAFSSENNKRPNTEIKLLFALFLHVLKAEVIKLNQKNIRLKFIGDLTIFPNNVQKLAKLSVNKLAKNTGLLLVIAVNYGGRWDIVRACQKITGKITEEKIKNNLSISDVDLLIRSSGEIRISNFLLWQCAYSEFYFTKTLWPDFDEDEFLNAINNFNNRQRTFGAILN